MVGAFHFVPPPTARILRWPTRRAIDGARWCVRCADERTACAECLNWNPEVDVSQVIADHFLVQPSGAVSRLCEHNVGHPIGTVGGITWHPAMGVHECDGCCRLWQQEEVLEDADTSKENNDPGGAASRAATAGDQGVGEGHSQER